MHFQSISLVYFASIGLTCFKMCQSSIQVEDALLCMLLQPGMAFKDEGDRMFICVSNLRWAVLAWPLLRLGDVDDPANIVLDPRGSLSWHFMVNKAQFRASTLRPSCVPGVGIACEISEWESPVKVVLRHFSEKLVFRDLVLLGSLCFKMTKMGSKSRVDLLKAIAIEAGGQEFAEEILSSQTKKRKIGDSTQFDDLAGCVLDCLDKDEAAEFDDIKQQIKNKEKADVASRWQKWRNEVSWLELRKLFF